MVALIVSKILSNGKIATSATEKFGKTIKTITKIMDKKGNVLVSRTKRTVPGTTEFRAQDTFYRVADDMTLGVRKEFALLNRHAGSKYIQEAVSIKNPSSQNFGDAAIKERYNFGSGFYA